MQHCNFDVRGRYLRNYSHDQRHLGSPGWRRVGPGQLSMPAETGMAAQLETVAIRAADGTISLYDIYVIKDGCRSWIGSRRTLAQCQDSFEAHCGLKSGRK